MIIRALTLLILSTIFVQIHGMDGALAAEDMEPSMWERVTTSISQWFTNAQYDDEEIQGGIPGIRYLTHHHGGKCMFVCAVIIGGYLVHRQYKNKRREETEQETTAQQKETSSLKDYLKTAHNIFCRILTKLTHLIK